MPRLWIALAAFAFAAPVMAQAPAEALRPFPPSISLRGKDDRQQLLIAATIGAKTIDVTSETTFVSTNPNVIAVTADGIAFPLGNGETTIQAKARGKETTIKVAVRDAAIHLPVTFEKDVQPILARAGCNSGPCHGKTRGQNGFQLSLLGFDDDFDFAALTVENRGRRVFPASPASSLLLLKGAGEIAHGGGRKIRIGDPLYETMRRWIASGTPRTPPIEAKLLRISMEPSERILDAKTAQQLAVTAHFADGSTKDVTHLAMYQSNESVVAAVDARGRVQAGPLPGEAAIMARYLEKFAVCNVLIPVAKPAAPESYAKLPKLNFIDEHVWNKLAKLGIAPSEACSDATFLRRAYLDVIGRIPTPDETREFLADASPDRRAKLVERLLDRPEWGDFWANKWADLLRPNPYRVGIKAVFSMDSWLRDAFRRNMPYDQFVRAMLTAQGSSFRNGATVFYRDRREPEEIATVASQLFLGIRLDCAKCHHHPFEVWSQDDFFHFAAYFSRLGRKGVGLSPPISGGEEIVFAQKTGSLKHPRLGKEMQPKPLFGETPEVGPDDDLREGLVRWILSENQKYFAKVQVNRVWADLMGRGIVEPIDDLRATNPPTNGPLLDALAEQFHEDGYDLKKLVRRIMTSHVYALSSIPNSTNVGDLRNFSRHYRQRLRAEAMLDAVSDIVGVRENFDAGAPGTRAIEQWTVRTSSIFLDSFGRPNPNQDPPCERLPDTTVVQALHLMNSPNLASKVTGDAGRPAKLAASKKTPAEIVEELYLWVYARQPNAEERSQAIRRFEAANRRQAAEDLLWALLNTPEFVFKD
ncbi:MAG: DUF1549 and DUF1553 domain-containing protein [Gemmataceae bacterium]|nr:DUF1549 and DUF1553 domain-containing protein [Gemmataceae bacterium]